MSIKSVFQIIILLIIFFVLGGVYFKYFSNNNVIIEETEELINKSQKPEVDEDIKANNLEEDLKENKNLETIEENKNLETIEENKNLETIEENKNLETIEENKNLETIEENKNLKVLKKNNELKSKSSVDKKDKQKNKKAENLAKDVEYLTTDKKGNKYRIFATSGRTNLKNNNILDLDDVRGIITSKQRSNIYIVSDFAEYNSSNQNSKFYKNVVINYEEKQITCDNFDIDMETALAIAYNNVIVTDPKSIMKAGKITLDIETKDININPDNKKNKVTVVTN